MRGISQLIASAFLTMSIELVVLYLFKVRDKRLWFSLLINLLTNLLLNSCLSFLDTSFLYVLFLIIGEILVFLVEWFFYELLVKDEKNWLYSLSANLSSFIFGSLIINLLFLLI